MPRKGSSVGLSPTFSKKCYRFIYIPILYIQICIVNIVYIYLRDAVLGRVYSDLRILLYSIRTSEYYYIRSPNILGRYTLNYSYSEEKGARIITISRLNPPI